ncbi:MAG: response regulator transcription factor [Geobacteraceae bacterium]|nr:response regulator transcription factor [Geobacteraceae bacterium]
MKVLVSIRSLLFSEVLCKTLRSSGNGYDAQYSRRTPSSTSFKPDVILADQESLQNDEQQSWAEGKVLLIDTGLSEEEIMSLMRNHKLYGVFSLEADFQQLKKAITVIHAGQIWIDNEKLKIIIHGIETARPDSTFIKLSNKENQIAELVAEGYKNREIASRLFLSEQTIKSHLGRIFRKMQVTNRSQLVSMIIRNKLTLMSHNHRNVFPD